jgi:hypothetical protein
MVFVTELEDRQMLPAWAAPTDSELEATVRHDLRRPDAVLVDWDVEPVDHRIVSPGTAGLYRVSGSAADGDERLGWSLFVKVLQSARHWPAFDLLPADLREWMQTSMAWDYEVDVYWSALRHSMPGGLRLPRLYRVYDAGDQRLAMWMEDVRIADVEWDPPRFRRAATLLGRLDARMTVEDLLPSSASRVPGELLRKATRGYVETLAVPALLDDAVWRHPLVDRQDPALRGDLEKLAARIPGLVDGLDRLPQAMMHGDACPQNLLVPADGPDGFVPVDWSSGGLVAVGYDIAQLVVGHAHTGRLGPLQLPMLTDLVIDAYAGGLAWEGMPVETEDVRHGVEATLVLRSAFMSLPLDRLGEEPTRELATHVADRIRLTRYLVDLGLAR